MIWGGAKKSVQTLNETISHRVTSLCQQGVKLHFVEAVKKIPTIIFDQRH